MPSYLSCPLCLKSTLSDVQELQKTIASSLSRNLHCPICSASLKGLSSLHFHLATHIPIPSNLQGLSLPASPEQIPSLDKLDLRDGPNSPINKVDRGNTIQNDSSIGEETGIISHIKPVQYNCEYCGLVFSSEYFLTLHKDIIHSNINDYEVECKQCKSKFKSLEVYRDHVKEMHSDRRYICEQCPKSFKIRGGLLVHTRMFHDQSTPSTCQVCKKNFTSKARKELHEKRFHGKKNANKGSPVHKPMEISSDQEAKNSLENLIQETNIPNMLNSTENSLLNTIQASTSNYFTQNASPTPISPSKISSVIQNSQISSIKTHQIIERQASCPVLTGNIKEIRSKNVDKRCNTPTIHNAVQSNPYLKHGNLKDINASNACEFSSANILSSHYNNLSYSFPKLNEIQLGSLFPLSNFANGFNSQSLLSNSNYASLPDIHMERVENMETCSDKVIDTQLSPETKQLQETPVSYPHQQEISNASSDLSVSNSEASGSSGKIMPCEVKILDYSIYIPPTLNMPQYIVNSLNPQTDIINKMNDSLSKITTGALEADPSNKNEKEDLNNTTENKNRFNNKEETKKNQKVSVRKTFSSRGSEGKQWECKDCNKSYTTKYFLKKHRRLHTGETPYSCEECGKTFAFQQSYHKHVFYHSDDKPHICPHCGRAFKEMSTLHNHVRIHTGEKPFVCATCGKAFRQRVSYLVHQRIHTGSLPYRCDICCRSFRYKVSLRSHKCEGKSLKNGQRQNVGNINVANPESNVANTEPNVANITASLSSSPLQNINIDIPTSVLSSNHSPSATTKSNDISQHSTNKENSKTFEMELSVTRGQPASTRSMSSNSKEARAHPGSTNSIPSMLNNSNELGGQSGITLTIPAILNNSKETSVLSGSTNSISLMLNNSKEAKRHLGRTTSIPLILNNSEEADITLYKNRETRINNNVLPSYDEIRQISRNQNMLPFNSTFAVTNDVSNCINNKNGNTTNYKLKNGISIDIQSDLPVDNIGFSSPVNFDSVNISNVNIGGSFPSVSLDDDLDSDSFLKSLFS